MSGLYRLLLLVVLGYVGYALLLLMFQGHLIYPGRSLVPAAVPSGVAAAAETSWIVTSFGKVEGRFLAPKSAGRQPVVIFFHGNGELVDDLSPELERLRRIGCGILLVEYPVTPLFRRPHQRIWLKLRWQPLIWWCNDRRLIRNGLSLSGFHWGLARRLRWQCSGRYGP